MKKLESCSKDVNRSRSSHPPMTQARTRRMAGTNGSRNPGRRRLCYLYFRLGLKARFWRSNRAAIRCLECHTFVRPASKAAIIMETVNPMVTTRIDQFMAEGSRDYSAAATDDSPNWRAVEVHVFWTILRPRHHNQPRPRTVRVAVAIGGWSIATPGGFSASPSPGVVVAGNVVAFRREGGIPIIHVYLVPAGGGGFYYSGPTRKGIWEWIRQLFGGLSVSGTSWSRFTAATPFKRPYSL
jgi:hypothetical protein